MTASYTRREETLSHDAEGLSARNIRCAVDRWGEASSNDATSGVPDVEQDETLEFRGKLNRR
jgi:hypothetical protein